MAGKYGVGIIKLKNGCYGYRVSILGPDGKKHDSTFHVDKNGNPFKKAEDARLARAEKIKEIRNPPVPQNQLTDCPLSDMWDLYLDSVAPSKEPSTVRKYESLWRIHINPRFGKKPISKITTSDIESYLTDLYCNQNYSYKYVEAFYKLFLQLFSLAFRDKHISRDTFFEMFEHPSTKIRMPKMDQSDAEEYEKIETYTKGEIARIAKVLEGTNFYLPFLIAFSTGCRIGEVCGLMWEDYNFDTHVLTVRRQMSQENGEFVIKSVKTLASVREIDVPKILHDELCKHRRNHNSRMKNYKNPGLPTAYQSKIDASYVIDRTGKQPQKLTGPNFMCRKESGEYITPNSVKYWAREIEKRENIHFEFHMLRKTHLSYLAGMNVPAIELMKRAGHKKYETSMKYYINRSEESRQYLLNTIDRINLRAPRYRVYFDPERKNPVELSETDAMNILSAHAMIPKAYGDKTFSLYVETIGDDENNSGSPVAPASPQNSTNTNTTTATKPPVTVTQGADGGISWKVDGWADNPDLIREALAATGKEDLAEELFGNGASTQDDRTK